VVEYPKYLEYHRLDVFSRSKTPFTNIPVSIVINFIRLEIRSEYSSINFKNDPDQHLKEFSLLYW
jgi:hypothetical protein